MNKGYIIISLVVFVIIASGIFYYFYKQQTQQVADISGGEKLSVNLQECYHSYGMNGTTFGITVDITNIGTVAIPPATIWLLYDNKICDQKNLDKSYLLNDVFFKDSSEGRWFKCQVNLPLVSKDAEKVNKIFKLVYTVDNQDPQTGGVTIFSGSTEALCRVAVE